MTFYVLLLQALLWFEGAGLQNSFALDRATKLLESQDVRDRAWGAYLAGQNGLAELEPKLGSILEKASMSDECLVRSALDAAIKIRANLPTKILAPLYDRYPNEITILLAQSPQNHVDLILSLFRNQRVSARWLALGNLLLESKAPGFPLVLMQEMKQMQIVVSVHDPNHKGGGTGGSWGQGAGSFKVPMGYPPVTIYDFSDRTIPDAMVIAKGPHTIYATQTIIHPGNSAWILNGGGSIADYWESNAYRLEYISSLLNLPRDDINFNKYYPIEWNRSRQFIDDVTHLCSSILNKYDKIAILLRDAKLISQFEADTLANTIYLIFVDFRRDKTTELPDINLSRVVIEKQ